MGKRQKKEHRGNSTNRIGHNRKVQREAAQREQKLQEAQHRYQVAMSHMVSVLCTCSHCGTSRQISVEKDTLSVIEAKILHRCAYCNRHTAFDVVSQPQQSETTPHTSAEIVCKRLGIKPRFWNQYLLINGQKMRWYLDYAPLHKNLFYCPKAHHLAGTRAGFTPFYRKRACTIEEAMAEIVMYEDMLAGAIPATSLTPELKLEIRKQRIIRACENHDLYPVFNGHDVQIETYIASWKFDYTKDRVTLLHKNSRGAAVDPMTGSVIDYHIQYANSPRTVENVIEGIVSHDQWRANQGEPNDDHMG